ncbi:MAG: RNA-binding protein [Hyphomonadaceae bacterium]|nr:RNA-binding protein [Hyphomonadaceae bacterium]
MTQSSKPKDKLRERRCAATGETMSEDNLVRFALGPDDEIVPDVAANLPGRGVWVTATRAAIDGAVKRNAFARSLKQAVRARPDLADRTEEFLTRRCLDYLGLMRRAGALALGFEQVEAALRKRIAFALIEAADGADDGREKLLRLAVHSGAPHLSACFTAAELGVALGRAHVVHAAVLQERMAQRWVAEIGRLSGFRAIVPGSWPESLRLEGPRLVASGPDEQGMGESLAGGEQSPSRPDV